MIMPRIKYQEEHDEEKIKQTKMICKANQITDVIEKLNNTSANNLLLVKSLREELINITNSLLDVRIWTVDGVLCCTVLYPDPKTRTMFRGV